MLLNQHSKLPVNVEETSLIRTIHNRNSRWLDFVRVVKLTRGLSIREPNLFLRKSISELWGGGGLG